MYNPFPQLNADVLTYFGITVTFTPKAQGSTSQTITGIICRAPIEEQNVPGSQAGTSVIYLWVNIAILTPAPTLGDFIVINGVSYDIGAIYTDTQGGSTLRLGRNL
jgi:hypothetical protein